MIGPDLERSLQRAFEIAVDHEHEYLTLEHIFAALLENRSVREILGHCGGDLEAMRQDLHAFLRRELPKMPAGMQQQPVQTLAVQRVLQRAALHVQSCGKEEMEASNVLVSLFREPECHATYLMEQQGITRFDVINYISHGIAKAGPVPNPANLPEEGGEERQVEDDPLAAYCSDLVARARSGGIDPLIGRSHELKRCVQVLCRRKKNNPIFVGDPGVGKTAIAEGLALRIASGEVPELLADSGLYALDLGALLANTKFRGEFEARLKAVMKKLQEHGNAILFIDEIHTVVGAGATSGGSMDASNILKPALASGELRCMGSTTWEDYRSIFEKDHALSRRFQKIDVLEPSVEETFQILLGLRKHYERFHGIRYSRAALRAAAELAARHINQRHLPDKAIDVIDEVGAARRLAPSAKPGSLVGVREIEGVVASMARIPPRTVGVDDAARLRELEATLRRVVFDQDQAMKALSDAILLARSGLRQPGKTVGAFLFAGPTGVGKTEAAKQLAASLGIAFLRFDMSEYMEKHSVARLIGAPPGYVGFDQGGLLTDAVTKNPYSVLLLDEIEKAHPDVFNILLQVMDHASLTDHNGRKADFRNVILIMTSNAGASEMAKGGIGFGEHSPHTLGRQALEKLFSPEFRNRLDATIHFASLSPGGVAKIVEKFLGELSAQLLEKSVTLSASDQAIAWLAEKGYSPTFGARPLARLLDAQVKHKLAQAILFGPLDKGGRARLELMEDGTGIDLHCTAPHPRTKAAPSAKQAIPPSAE